MTCENWGTWGRFSHVVHLEQMHKTGLKMKAGCRTMPRQDDHLSGQNLGLAVILTSNVHGFQIVNLKNNIICFISEKYINS